MRLESVITCFHVTLAMCNEKLYYKENAVIVDGLRLNCGSSDPLVIVQTCQIACHPTGSRVFDKVHTGSDYDFIVEDSPENRLFFARHGFRECIHEGYGDTLTSIVMEKGNVHLQFCHNVPMKLLAQNVLLSDFRNRNFLYSLQKEERKRVWGIAISGVLMGWHEGKNAVVKAWNE